MREGRSCDRDSWPSSCTRTASPDPLSHTLLCVYNDVQGRNGEDGPSCPAVDGRMLAKVIRVLLKMLTVTPAQAKPSNKDAQRILSFFMSSLSNRQLEKPPPLVRTKDGWMGGWVDVGTITAAL